MSGRDRMRLINFGAVAVTRKDENQAKLMISYYRELAIKYATEDVSVSYLDCGEAYLTAFGY